MRVTNQSGVRIDSSGYAIVPNAVPYRNNAWSLNTRDFPDGLDVPLATKNSVPSRGRLRMYPLKHIGGKRVDPQPVTG